MVKTMTEYEYNPTEIESRDQFVAEAKADPYSTMYNFAADPRDIFDFKVVEKEEAMSWGESYIGGPLGCVTDYGDHWDLTDQELIDKVAEKWSGKGLVPQFLGFMDDDKETVSETVLIVRKENGYVKTTPLA